MENQYLVFDIGGTNIKYSLMDHSGKIVEESRLPTPNKNKQLFFEVVHKKIGQFREQIKGLAFSVPGKVDLNNTVYFGGSLPFLHGIRFNDEFAEYGLPVAVENDGKAAALAELWLGNLRGISNGAAIILGTGVGGGIVLHGELIKGTHFQAGELSFMFTDKKAAGLKGVAGFNASAVAMIKKIAKTLALPDLTDGAAVFEAINSGDRQAKMIFEEFCLNAAYVIYNIQSVIDLERFVIGGGISKQKIVIETIVQQYKKLLASHSLLENSITPPQILPCCFSSEANMYGALYTLFLQKDLMHDGPLI